MPDQILQLPIHLQSGNLYKLNSQSSGRVLIHSTSFSSHLTNKPKKLVLYYSGLEMLVRDKLSILLNPFVSYAKK